MLGRTKGGMTTRLAARLNRISRCRKEGGRMRGACRTFSSTSDLLPVPTVSLDSLLQRIDECNTLSTKELDSFVRFTVDGRLLGFIKDSFVDHLGQHEDVFTREGRELSLHPRLEHERERTEAVGLVMKQLEGKGLIAGWRDELFPVKEKFEDPPVFFLERAAVPYFGIKAYGVHVNGFVKDPSGTEFLWVARRSISKPTFPGMLDHMVAGGQGDISCMNNVIKEAQEEAGIPLELAKKAKSVGAVSYQMKVPEGVKRDVLYTYDLELPRDFVPRAVDGEVEQFMLWPMEQVIDSIAKTQKWKPNCTLVVIDFLVRHGYINADGKGYLKLLSSLRQADLS